MGAASEAARDLRAAFGALDEQLPRAVDQEAGRALEGIQAQFFPYVSNKNPSQTMLQGRSWELRDAIRFLSKQAKDGVTCTFFLDPSAEDSTRIAAWVNEFGKSNITPKRYDKMNIPVGDALDAHGVRRFETTREAAEEYLLVWMDDVIKGRPHGTDEPLEVLYVRRESVDVPARPFMQPNLAAMVDHLVRRVDRLLSRVATR